MREINTRKWGWLLLGILALTGPLLLGMGPGTGTGPPPATNSPPAPVVPQPGNPQNPNPSSPYFFPRTYPQGQSTYVPVNRPTVRPTVTNAPTQNRTSRLVTNTTPVYTRTYAPGRVGANYFRPANTRNQTNRPPRGSNVFTGPLRRVTLRTGRLPSQPTVSRAGPGAVQRTLRTPLNQPVSINRPSIQSWAPSYPTVATQTNWTTQVNNRQSTWRVNNTSSSFGFRGRLGAAGAKQGALQVSLIWPTNKICDLDIHLTEPNGNVISYMNKISASGGELDIDCVSCPTCIENIYWPSSTGAPAGQYGVRIDDYSIMPTTLPVDYTVIVQTAGGDVYTCSATYTGSGVTELNLTFNYSGGTAGRISGMTGCDGRNLVGGGNSMGTGAGRTGVWWINNGFPRGQTGVRIGRGNFTGYGPPGQPDRISTRGNCCGRK